MFNSLRVRYGLAFLSMGWFGCASQVRLAPTEEPAPVVSWTSPKGPLWLRADSLFAFRENPMDMRHAETIYAQAAMAQPQVPALLAQWSRACYLTALYGHLESEQRHAYFRRGIDAGEAALQLHPGYARIYSETSDESEAASALTGPFLEAAYWVAANEGRLLNESDRFVRRGRGTQVAALVNRLLEVADTLYYGGPHRLSGAMALHLSGPSGAGLNKAKNQFQTALALAPQFLGNAVVYAEFFGPATGDRAFFVSTLEAAIAAPFDSLAPYAPENRLEQKRAATLLRLVDSFFPLKATQVEP
jgi:TRAP transporter T-component